MQRLIRDAQDGGIPPRELAHDSLETMTATLQTMLSAALIRSAPVIAARFAQRAKPRGLGAWVTTAAYAAVQAYSLPLSAHSDQEDPP